MKLILVFAALFSLVFNLSAADVAGAPSPEGAKVYIVSPLDGETVEGPVTVVFGLKGMGVAPAGVDIPNTGHHHLLIDATELPEAGVSMPATPHLKHFGKGQTEVELNLDAGEHTLQLVLGDMLHRPHVPPVISEKITITVQPAAD